MELFIRIGLIIMLVLGAALMLTAFISQGDAGVSTVVSVIGTLFGVAMIVISFMIGAPWYIIAMLFVTTICFIISCIPTDSFVGGFACGLIIAICNLISVLLVFLR